MEPTEIVQGLLDACKSQHDAIDRLFAELIRRDNSFFPSKSGRPWEATLKGNEAIARAEQAFGDFSDARVIRLDAIECGVLLGLLVQANPQARMMASGVAKQLRYIKNKAEQEAGVKKEIIKGGMLQITDKHGNVIIRPPYPFEVEGN